MNVSPYLEKVEKLEKDLQELKVNLLLDFIGNKKTAGTYKEEDIVREIRRTRKKLWNDKYAKTAKGLS